MNCTQPPQGTAPFRMALLRGGFTLIEILVVITIIGVLVAALIPTVSKMQGYARSVKCASNMRQIAVTLISYANDHDARTVIAHYPENDYNWAQEVTAWDGTIKTLSQGKSYGIWRCPENMEQTKSPMANGSAPANTSYMINGYRNSTQSSENRYSQNALPKFRNPSRLCMVLEGRYFRCEVSSQSGSQTIPENIYETPGSLNYARYPHGGKMNVAFADGHVSQVQGPVLDRGASGNGANGFSNGDFWYAY